MLSFSFYSMFLPISIFISTLKLDFGNLVGNPDCSREVFPEGFLCAYGFIPIVRKRVHDKIICYYDFSSCYCAKRQ